MSSETKAPAFTPHAQRMLLLAMALVVGAVALLWAMVGPGVFLDAIAGGFGACL